MRHKRSRFGILCFVMVFVASTAAVFAGTPPYDTEQELGHALYFDKDLSLNRNQACSSCHLPAAGFDDPDSNLPVSRGSILTKFGTRNAPSSAYAAFAPAFGLDPATGLYIGGQFWDGRVDNLAQQAAGPPLNSVEMAMAGEEAVVQRLAENPAYVDAFMVLYGIDLNDPASVNRAYDSMANAIGEFERTRRFNKFNSKFDYFLANLTTLTGKELRGWNLFQRKAKCALCHLVDVTVTDGKILPPLFTDFTYDNLGIPVNPTIAKLQGVASLPPDLGLGGILGDPDQDGKFKVMTLRNIALTAPYGHNGYFKTLKDIVHFYNTRDVLPDCALAPVPVVGRNCWPAAEVPLTVNSTELGNLNLTPAEEDDVVAFLNTLTDGKGPSPYGVVPVPPMP